MWSLIFFLMVFFWPPFLSLFSLSFGANEMALKCLFHRQSNLDRNGVKTASPAAALN